MAKPVSSLGGCSTRGSRMCREPKGSPAREARVEEGRLSRESITRLALAGRKRSRAAMMEAPRGERVMGATALEAAAAAAAAAAGAGAALRELLMFSHHRAKRASLEVRMAAAAARTRSARSAASLGLSTSRPTCLLRMAPLASWKRPPVDRSSRPTSSGGDICATAPMPPPRAARAARDSSRDSCSLCREELCSSDSCPAPAVLTLSALTMASSRPSFLLAEMVAVWGSSSATAEAMTAGASLLTASRRCSTKLA